MFSITCLSDSQGDPDAGFGVDGFDTWPAQLQRQVKAEGLNARVRSFAKSGDTSAQLLARVDDAVFYDIPGIAVPYIGVNDPGGGINQAGTQANIQAIIKSLKHNAVGGGLGGGVTVADETALPATGRVGQRYVVLADGSSTGGMPAVRSTDAATITGAGGSAQTVWEFRYPAAGVLGWGRVAAAATAASACKRIVVVSTNYLNFTTGGDTTVTPYATYATVRTAQQAAVTAENVVIDGASSVVYADLYALQKALIVAGTVPDFSAVSYDQTKSWHYKQDNQHHNAFGHALVAQAVRAAFPSSWVTALS